MKKLLILLVFLLTTSFNPCNRIHDFHVDIVGEEQVKVFEKEHPQIVANDKVYIAYLQQYYNLGDNQFINLLQ